MEQWLWESWDPVQCQTVVEQWEAWRATLLLPCSVLETPGVAPDPCSSCPLPAAPLRSCPAWLHLVSDVEAGVVQEEERGELRDCGGGGGEEW